jgi:hypothetical protein
VPPHASLSALFAAAAEAAILGRADTLALPNQRSSRRTILVTDPIDIHVSPSRGARDAR